AEMTLRHRAVQPLIGAAWLVSTISIPTELAGRTRNWAFGVACALLVAACLAGWDLLRAGLRSSLLLACALACAAFALPALPLAQGAGVGRGCLRACAVAGWATLLIGFGDHARLALARAASVLVLLNAALLIASLTGPVRALAFEIAAHEFVGGLPRFRGLA